MQDIILIMMSISAFLVVYWVIIGQWKYNKMLRHPENISCILFDLDGVIIDSFDAWFKLFNKARKHFRLPVVTKKEFRDKAWGGSVENNANKFFKGKDAEEMSKFYFSQFDNFKKDTKLVRGVKETLKELNNMGFKLAVVSNTPKEIVVDILRYHKILEYFKVVVGGDDVEEGKPEPYSILQACKRLIIKPNHGLFVGDTDTDKLASKRAGMLFVGYGGVRGDFNIHNFEDIILLL